MLLKRAQKDTCFRSTEFNQDLDELERIKQKVEDSESLSGHIRSTRPRTAGQTLVKLSYYLKKEN